jgi:hypothetical protein
VSYPENKAKGDLPNPDPQEDPDSSKQSTLGSHDKLLVTSHRYSNLTKDKKNDILGCEKTFLSLPGGEQDSDSHLGSFYIRITTSYGVERWKEAKTSDEPLTNQSWVLFYLQTFCFMGQEMFY